MQENLHLKLSLATAQDQLRALHQRTQELEHLHVTAAQIVIPNLRRLAKAVTVQAVTLAKALPDYPPEGVVGTRVGDVAAAMAVGTGRTASGGDKPDAIAAPHTQQHQQEGKDQQKNQSSMQTEETSPYTNNASSSSS